MSSEPFMALEIHDASLWEPARVLSAVDHMERWGYNALVLHQNDLLDAATQVGLTANYGVTDLRLKKVRNAAAWLNRLTRRLGRFGAELWLEIKEPSFHDYAPELFPGLLGANGLPDPFAPDWAAFCRAKTEDLLDRVPGLGGLILNLSSPESRVSLPDHIAQTDAGGMDAQAAWFDKMIAAFHGPLAAAGKGLFVRDFSYTEDAQSEVLEAATRAGVGASVKITAHDYFPGFPENPGLAKVQGRCIVEVEAFGEHTGWGCVPNCRVGEFARRMVPYRDAGRDGLLVRISWEAVAGVTALESLSAVNVFALPKLAQGDAAPDALVTDWLTEDFGLDSSLAADLARLLLESWNIPAAIYWGGAVFPRHSCLPSTWQEGWLSMETSGMGRRDRVLNIRPGDPRLTDAAGAALFAEKEDATALAVRISQEASVLAGQVPERLARLMRTFDWLPAFALMFELATKATFMVARGAASDDADLLSLVGRLNDLAAELEGRLSASDDLPHHHHVLFDPAQIRLFCGSLISEE